MDALAAVAVSGILGILIGLAVGYGLGWSARAQWSREPFEGLRPGRTED